MVSSPNNTKEVSKEWIQTQIVTLYFIILMKPNLLIGNLVHNPHDHSYYYKNRVIFFLFLYLFTSHAIFILTDFGESFEQYA
ncbi:hypothetical protein VIGAN_04224200 [Vigna angularis var. angularis]|uniref:Uncharacterized protein n=1 Tax=Vigna angularis var. angularis TaxID=157739 RepID=A0A0S3RW28_PHAAN|nr:hypothetical protein VIGAN_04224200 [Vigna angularis var. angularis]